MGYRRSGPHRTPPQRVHLRVGGIKAGGAEVACNRAKVSFFDTCNHEDGREFPSVVTCNLCRRAVGQPTVTWDGFKWVEDSVTTEA